MGPVEQSSPGSQAIALPPKPRPVQDPTRPPPRAEQGKPHGYRVRYTKLGRVAYLGHLDLVRHLPRIFRRAGFEIYYSVGFHPKPELSFGPALGLGIPSLGEILDVKLVDDLPPGEVARRLARVSLDGIEILDVARVLDNDRALGRVITESETIAQLPVGTDVAAALARFAGDEPLKLLRESEKAIARTVDVRKTLRSLSPFEDAEARRRLGWNDGPMISFSVSVSNEGSAKPSEVVTTLFGLEIAQRTDLARRALWGDERTDPLGVSELRLRAVVARPAAAAAAP
jgi:radical SAM-linked protein